MRTSTALTPLLLSAALLAAAGCASRDAGHDTPQEDRAVASFARPDGPARASENTAPPAVQTGTDAVETRETASAQVAPARPRVDPENLGASLRTRAEAALSERDLAAAEEHYRGWLAADPQDASSWYNLACVQSLRGEHEDAILSFRASLTAGFDQLDHARVDSDLDAIRGDARFEAALAAAEAKRAGDAISGSERHVIETPSLGTYVVMLPPDYATSDRTYPVCVILHGSGSDEVSHGRVSERLGRDDVVYVAPRALQAHVGATIGRGKAGWTVWPPEDPGAGEQVFPMTTHVEWVFRCVDDVARRYRVHADRVAIWGHSQGAASAVACAALHPDRVATICAYAGYYPEHEVTPARVKELAARGVRIELGHSRDDRVVDPSGTEQFARRLAAAGATFGVEWFESGGHSLSKGVMDWSAEWMRSWVRDAR